MKCEGKSESFYFPWKKVSSHVRECPNDGEKKGNFSIILKRGMEIIS